MKADDLQRLMGYRLWARGRVLASLEALPAETFTAPAVSSFPSIRDTLVHILSADMIWASRLGGSWPDAHLRPEDYPDMASLQARWEAVDRALRAVVEGPPPADPGRVVTYRTTAGVEYHQPLGQIVQHLVNHQTYHLGQVATLIRQFGGRPPSIDLAVFDREGSAG